MRLIRHFLLVLMLMCGFTASAENDYVLVDSIQGGVILHCFGWTYKQITNELDSIAAAGFTAVQTSPVQILHPDHDAQREALYNYPIGLTLNKDRINNLSTYLSESELDDEEQKDALENMSPLGSSDDLKTLCDSAHSRGIFVIVEINANGLYWGDDDDSDSIIQNDLAADSCWHTETSTMNEANRYSITYAEKDKLRDLATENELVQQCVVGFLKELDSIGVDGIRWHQAANISLPSEKFVEVDGTSNFWPTVTTNSGLDLYNYGVIYDSPSTLDKDDSLMAEYAKYMSITDDEYGKDVIKCFDGGDKLTTYANWAASSLNIPLSRIVYLSDSYETYYLDQADEDYTGDISQNVADRAWAVVASHCDATALYFSRPTDNDDITVSEVNEHFTSPEVAAVNHFHNISNGESDYFSSNDSVISICRESGAVIVLISGQDKEVTAVNGQSYTTAGTYTDEITGNTFTVTESTITGTVGSTGIAVLYSDSALLPKITLDPNGGNFADEITVTATLNTFASSGTIKVGDGEEQTITETTTVTIGEDMNIGDSVTIYWTATDGSQTRSGSSIYVKSKLRDISIYVKNTANNEDSVHIYAWLDDSPVTEPKGEWPGVGTTIIEYVNGQLFWREDFEDVFYVNIIFSCSDTEGSRQTNNITGIDEDAYFLYNDSTEYEIITPPGILPARNEKQPLFVYLVNNAYYKDLTVSIWDKDNNYFTSEKGDTLTNIVSTYEDYGSYYDVYKWNYNDSLYNDSLISTPSGLIFTGVDEESNTVTTDTLRFYNGGWYSNAKTWFFTQGKVFRCFQVIYDEATANGYYNTDSLSSDEIGKVYSTLVREFDQSYWNTICLPFSVSKDTIENIFGSTTDIEQFDSVHGTTLYFINANSIEAGVPYLIKPGATVTNPKFYNPHIVPQDTQSIVRQNEYGDKYKFTGTYSPYALDTLTDMFLDSSGSLLHPIPTDYIIKGLRAFVTLPDSSITAAAVSFEPLISTGINRVDTDDDNDAAAAADIYSISGQKVNGDISTLPQGIYITRGRKIIIK